MHQLPGAVYPSTFLKVDIDIKVILDYEHLALAHFIFRHLICGDSMGTRTNGTTGIDENNLDFIIPMIR